MKSKRVVLLLSVLMLILLLATAFTASAADEEITPKMSVTMAERLVFNIYVPKNESIVEIKLDGAVQDLSSLPEKNGYSHLEIPLDSCDADREIKLVLTVDGNGGKKTGTFTFSLVKYAAKLINGNETETVKKLAKDILGYVNSARKYFGKESSDSIEELIGDYDFVFDPVSQENATIGLKLVTFVLESKPAVRFYLADGFNASDFTFTQDNKTLQFATGSDEYGKGKLDYFISVSAQYPVIATTSKLLSTGADCKMVKLIKLNILQGSCGHRKAYSYFFKRQRLLL